MLNFAPTQEQEEIRRLAHSLAVELLRPQGRQAEKQEIMPAELARTLHQTGLTTPFSEEQGGSGTIEAVTYTLIAEELGFGDGGLALNIIGSLMGPVAVMLAGNAEQQQRYIPPFTNEQNGYSNYGSLAFAERTGGFTIEDIQAILRSEGDHYILNGIKRDVIHGADATLRIVLARLENTSEPEGLCAVIVPENAEGLHITEDREKLGMKAAPSATLICTNVTIPVANVLGSPGNAGVIRTIALYNILRAAIACGIARAALEYAMDYGKERIAFGRPIVSYQGIAFLIAEMAMKLDATRLLVWRAAASWDREDCNLAQLLQDAEAAQRQALKIAQKATPDAIQVMGGAGFMQDHLVEMWMRDAAAME